ncbi:hypothetical protein TorRG33x02_289360 [Trema orientale]|uniref:Uncharacterized protein n=1 Tax=Trema orientale TaxID=63057 RepID=A0A2P5CD96_TREOI|nr:hypothetical protein TorRG33x02_289360 [Trema orientale]
MTSRKVNFTLNLGLHKITEFLTRQPDPIGPNTKIGSDTSQFTVSTLKLSHLTLSVAQPAACHAPSLPRLADTRRIPLVPVTHLCSSARRSTLSHSQALSSLLHPTLSLNPPVASRFSDGHVLTDFIVFPLAHSLSLSRSLHITSGQRTH